MPFFVCLLIIWKIYSVRFTSLPEYIPIQERILQPDSLQNLLTHRQVIFACRQGAFTGYVDYSAVHTC